MNRKNGNPIALLPIGVFLVLYLGLGLVFEYVLKIEMGFYNIPIVVVFLVALLVAFCQNKGLKFDEKLEVVSRGVGNKDIMTMVLIFLAAGIFVGVVRGMAEFSHCLFHRCHCFQWVMCSAVFLKCCSGVDFL